MLPRVHQFSPTSVFAVQVHNEVANQYEGGLSVGGPSPLDLASASTAADVITDSVRSSTLRFTRDLFADYAESIDQLLRQRWVERLPALAATAVVMPTSSNNKAADKQSKLPDEFVVPFQVEPLLSSATGKGASEGTTSASFTLFKLTVFDTRVASHIYRAISKRQFISLHCGKLMALPEAHKKQPEGENQALPEAEHFNFDDELFSHIKEGLKKGSVAEDKSKCSPTYMTELEESLKTAGDNAGENDNDEDDDNPNTSGGAGGKAKKRQRDGKDEPSAAKRDNPIILSASGKGPFFLSIGGSVSALTAWISVQVAYIGAFGIDGNTPSPFAFALHKLLSLKLLPNEIVTKFASHKNRYVRAVGVVAARFTFPPEELVPVLVPTLDQGAAVERQKPTPTTSGKPGNDDSYAPIAAAAASAVHQADVTVSPALDAVCSFAKVVAEIAFDPNADAYEFWFPKYDDIILEALKLRLAQYHNEIRKQKELMNVVAKKTVVGDQQGKSSSAAHRSGAQQRSNNGKASSSVFARIDPRKMKELAERHQRLQEAKNLALIDENDDTFDVESASSSSDEGGNDGNKPHHHEHHVSAIVGSGRYVAPSHMQDEAAFENNGQGVGSSVISAIRKKKDTGKEPTAALDEDALYRRTLGAEARRAVLAVDYGSAFASQANRVVLGLLGLQEQMRADDDLYLKF